MPSMIAEHMFEWESWSGATAGRPEWSMGGRSVVGTLVGNGTRVTTRTKERDRLRGGNDRSGKNGTTIQNPDSTAPALPDSASPHSRRPEPHPPAHETSHGVVGYLPTCGASGQVPAKGRSSGTARRERRHRGTPRSARRAGPRKRVVVAGRRRRSRDRRGGDTAVPVVTTCIPSAPRSISASRPGVVQGLSGVAHDVDEQRVAG